MLDPWNVYRALAEFVLCPGPGAMSSTREIALLLFPARSDNGRGRRLPDAPIRSKYHVPCRRASALKIWNVGQKPRILVRREEEDHDLEDPDHR
jgi:hypothetical protein